jgi:hypothetical protein
MNIWDEFDKMKKHTLVEKLSSKEDDGTQASMCEDKEGQWISRYDVASLLMRIEIENKIVKGL